MKWKDDPIGKDCINLDITLANWLAPRLKFLSENTHGWPHVEGHEETTDKLFKYWKNDLRITAKALQDYADAGGNFCAEEEDRTEQVQKAMQWVADNFTNLWD